MTQFSTIPSLALAILLAGCSKHAEVAPGIVQGQSEPVSSLAYEHTVSVSTRSEAIAIRIDDIRRACTNERFGACDLLRVEQTNDRLAGGSVTVRVAPEGVEPLIELAGKEGTFGHRVTRAEDLADVVANAQRQREELESQRATLLELKSQGNLAVADGLAIARELAAVTRTLTEIDREQAKLELRLATNLLTVNFSSDEESNAWAGVGDALAEAADSFADGLSESIGVLAFGFPFLLVAFPVALAWRWLWRKITRRG